MDGVGRASRTTYRLAVPPAGLPVDDDDDDFQPPVAVHVEQHLTTICPTCSRPFKRHNAMELLRCTQEFETAADAADDVAASPDPPAVEGVEAAAEPAGSVEVVVVDARTGGATTAATPPKHGAPKAIETTAREFDPNEWEPDDAPVVDHARGVVTLPSRELDFEELAAALRNVIEKERDEIVRRGGPLEKQNAELKERLADALDNAAMWRRRAQTAATERNLYKEQIDEQVRTNRKLRNELKGRKENNRARVLELSDLLRIVQSEPGFTVERAGNGHFVIRKEGVFVTDAASSGQGNKVNMATRVALRKVGLEV